MFRALKYIFSSDRNSHNMTYYGVRIRGGQYVKQAFVEAPWVRMTTGSLSGAMWMDKERARDLCSRLAEDGDHDAAPAKVRWWNVMMR